MTRSLRFKLVIFLASVGLGLISVVGWFYFQQSETKLYTNKTYGFRIRYPVDWEVHENMNGAAVIFVSPKDNELDVLQDSVNIVVQDYSKDPISLTDYSEKAEHQVRATFKAAIEILDSSPTTLAGLPAHRFALRSTGPDLNLQYLMVWTMKGYTAYQVTYTSLTSGYELYLPKVQRMIRSFRINN